MPKKTKKEKIIAEYRKKIKLLQLNHNSFVFQKPNLQKTEKKVERSPTLQSRQSGKELNKAEIDNIPDLSRFFIKDLKKTLFLSGFIIALEIIFYFVTINNYLRLK